MIHEKSDLVPLLFDGEHLVRTFIDAAGEPWFVGTDVCRILGIRNAPDALSRLDPDERMKVGSNPAFRQKGIGKWRYLFAA